MSDLAPEPNRWRRIATVTDDSGWPCWEDWTRGWDVIDDVLCLEGRPVPDLPPHLPIEHRWPEDRPGPRGWRIRYPFENGWQAVVYPDWGVAVGAAAIAGINARVLGADGWPTGPDGWDDPATSWQWSEMELLDTSAPYLDGPEHLRQLLAIIAALPSHRGPQ